MYSPTIRRRGSVEDIGNLLLCGASSTSGKIRLDINLASSKSARKTELRRNSLDTMSGVDVLDKGDLIACGRALTRDNSGVGQEELPDLHVSLAII